MSALPNEETAQLIDEFVGTKFFTVSFIKNDGTVRILNGRSRDRKFEHKRYLLAWDAEEKEYRFVNVETIQWLRCKGMEIDMRSTNELPFNYG